MTKGPELARNAENLQLHQALRAWCRRGVEIATAKLEQCPEPEEFRQKTIEAAVSGRGWSYGYSTDWSRVVTRYMDALTQVGEYAEAMEALTRDETISRQLGEEVWVAGQMSKCPGPAYWTRELLVACLGEGSGAFEDEAFDTLYAGFEDYFYGNRVTLRCLAPLGGFDMQAEHIVLDPGLSIVALKESERAAILWGDARFPMTRMYSPWQMAERRYAFELHVEVQKRVGLDRDAVVDQGANGDTRWMAMGTFDEVCTALRVFKQGDVGYDFIWISSAPWVAPHVIHSFGPMASRAFWPGTYLLPAEEASQLGEFWRNWRSRKREENLDLALRRFNLGCERRLPEDRLIDYVIALEALLLKGDDRELGYRLSLRAGALLARDPGEAQAIQSDVKTAYDVRSRTVHGGRRGPPGLKLSKWDDSVGKWVQQDVSLEQFAEGVGNYLRRVLREFNVRVKERKHRTVLDDLDERISRGCGAKEVG